MNYGIPEKVIASALESMKTYIALPLETKMEASVYYIRYPYPISLTRKPA